MERDGAFRIGILASALSAEPRAAIRAARLNGFSGLQFDVMAGNVDLTDLSATGRREFRHALAAENQQLVALRTDLAANGLAIGSDIDQIVARLDRIMKAAVGLGCPLVCVELGLLPAVAIEEQAAAPITPQQAGLILLPEQSVLKPKRSVQRVAPPDPAFVSQVQSTMIEIGRRADRYSCVLALRSELASLASLQKVLREADCPWFGLDLNPAGILIDDWELDEVFSRLGSWVRHVRGSDAVAGADRRTKPVAIGRGNVQWDALLENLRQSDYRGWITVDPSDLPDRVEGARKGLQCLQSR